MQASESQQVEKTLKEFKMMASTRALQVFESRPIQADYHQEKVEKIRLLCATLWAELDSIAVPAGIPEVARLLALAKTDAESAAMWATKAVSRFSPSRNQ